MPLLLLLPLPLSRMRRRMWKCRPRKEEGVENAREPTVVEERGGIGEGGGREREGRDGEERQNEGEN